MKNRIAAFALAALIVMSSLILTASSDPSLARYHDIHISFGRAELGPKIFIAKLTLYKDDFLKAINNWHVGGYGAMSTDEFRALELRYINAYFRVWGDSSRLVLTSSKRSDEESSITFELAYALAGTPQIIMLDNRILFREYSDETNVLVLKGYGKLINHVFTRSEPTFYFRR